MKLTLPTISYHTGKGYLVALSAFSIGLHWEYWFEFRLLPVTYGIEGGERERSLLGISVSLLPFCVWFQIGYRAFPTWQPRWRKDNQLPF